MDNFVFRLYLYIYIYIPFYHIHDGDMIMIMMMTVTTLYSLIFMLQSIFSKLVIICKLEICPLIFISII